MYLIHLLRIVTSCWLALISTLSNHYKYPPISQLVIVIIIINYLVDQEKARDPLIWVAIRLVSSPPLVSWLRGWERLPVTVPTSLSRLPGGSRSIMFCSTVVTRFSWYIPFQILRLVYQNRVPHCHPRVAHPFQLPPSLTPNFLFLWFASPSVSSFFPCSSLGLSHQSFPHSSLQARSPPVRAEMRPII